MPNALIAGLTALLMILWGCAPIQERPEARKSDVQLVFPLPPDEPRFHYERTLYGSADVVPADDEFALRSYVTGESRGTVGMAKPYSIAAAQGRLYVSDTVARLVWVYDIPRGRHSVMGADEEGEGKLVKPLGLDVDQAGKVYVADVTEQKIKVYGPDGKFVRSIGSSKQLVRPASVTVEPSGARVFVVDIGGVSSEEHKIKVFDGNTGSHLYDIGKRGNGPGEFNLPRDTALGKDGLLYVVDGGNFRIQVLNTDGTFVRQFGGVGRQFGQFARPKEVAVGPEGNVYVVDAAFGNFQIFNPEGQLLLFIGSRSESDGPGRYMLPSGIAVDDDGRVYFVDQWFRKVDVFRPAGLKPKEGYGVLKPSTPGTNAAAPGQVTR